MADRIFVLASNPGRFKTEITTGLARPRNRRAPEFEAMVDRSDHDRAATPEAETAVVAPGLASPRDFPLPHVSVGGLAGLLEILNDLGGREDLPHLGRLLTFEVDDLLPIVDAAKMLGFAEVADADIELTAEGKALSKRTS